LTADLARLDNAILEWVDWPAEADDKSHFGVVAVLSLMIPGHERAL
jgi:hypothetical protein